MNKVLLKNKTFVFYNFYMKKLKIFTTLFIIYEFVVITVLQIPVFCNALFNYNFCGFGGFKYFLFCVMLPTLVCLLFWWLPRKEIETKKSSQDILFDLLPPQYIKRFLIAVVIVGLRKFIMSHPRTRNFMNDVKGVMKKQKAQ